MYATLRAIVSHLKTKSRANLEINDRQREAKQEERKQARLS